MPKLSNDQIRKKIENGTIYNEFKYVRWRKRVFKRDGYCCQFPDCKWPKGSLNAHHIKMKWYYPDLIFVIGNGITLCEYHHKYIHSQDSNNFVDMLSKLADRNAKKPRISKKIVKKKKKASKKKTRSTKKKVIRFKRIKLRGM